jgi:hypothetical protein
VADPACKKGGAKLKTKNFDGAKLKKLIGSCGWERTPKLMLKLLGTIFAFLREREA